MTSLRRFSTVLITGGTDGLGRAVAHDPHLRPRARRLGANAAVNAVARGTEVLR